MCSVATLPVATLFAQLFPKVVFAPLFKKVDLLAVAIDLLNALATSLATFTAHYTACCAYVAAPLDCVETARPRFYAAVKTIAAVFIALCTVLVAFRATFVGFLDSGTSNFLLDYSTCNSHYTIT